MSWESFFSAGLSDDDAAVWGRLLVELGATHDAIASSRFDRATVEALTEDVRAWRERLDPLAVEETEQTNGRVPQVAVRGHAMLPRLRIHDVEDGRFSGRIRFGRWFMGGGMAVHGGAVSLLFDELLGIVGAVGSDSLLRTAYLHTDFRALTPVDVDLDAVAWIESTEGRKLIIRGELRHGDVVCAEAEGLFLKLRDDQGFGRRTT